MSIGIISDLHLGVNHYSKMDGDHSRYLTKTFEVLEWCLNYFSEHGIQTIIIPGDLFDRPNVPTFVLEKAKRLFEPFNVYVIKGNHDDSSLLHKNEMGPIQLIGVNAITTPKVIKFGGINFCFIPWGYDIPKPVGRSVLVTHAFPRKTFDDGLTESDTNGYDLVITGHDHLAYDFTSNTRYLNPGSIMPSASKGDHEPSLWVLNPDLSYERVKIPVAPRFVYAEPSSIDEYLLGIDKEWIYTVSSDYYPSVNALKHAKNIALNVKLDIHQSKVSVDQVDDFWSFIHSDYPVYEGEFKEKLTECSV